MRERGKGRRFALDIRDGRYLSRDVTPASRPRRKTWRLGARLDQGPYPHCVGYAWRHFLLAAPRRLNAPTWTGGAIYHLAQRLDEWDGTEYDGTSVRGGARALTEVAKLVAEYRWAFSAEDALNAVGNAGPVVMGTDWRAGMNRADNEGIIRYTGRLDGGHAYLLIGYDDRRELALVHNSWGEGWGVRGRAWLPYADLEQAIRDAGEACMAVERAR